MIKKSKPLKKSVKKPIKKKKALKKSVVKPKLHKNTIYYNELPAFNLIGHAVNKEAWWQWPTYLMVLEFPPQKRFVILNDEPNYLYFPYTYFFIKFGSFKNKYHFHQLSVGFSVNKSMHSGELFNLQLGNDVGKMQVCLGQINWQHNSILKLTNEILNAYWNKSFSYTYNLKYLDKWIRITKNKKPNISSLLRRDEKVLFNIEFKHGLEERKNDS